MKRMRIFTEKISPVNKENPSWERSAAFVKLRNRLYKSRLMIVAFVLGNLLMVSTGYAATVTTRADKSISADIASNSFTTCTIVITEETDNDFGNSGDLIINAPDGWVFQTAGVSTSVTGDNGQNISIGTIQYTANKITIQITVNRTNKHDVLTISGIQVKSIDGGNVPGTGNITASGTLPTGLTTTTNLGTLTQTVGALSKIVVTLPGETFTDGTSLASSGNTDPATTQTAGTAFNVKLTATDQFFNIITTFTGTGNTASITSTGPLSAGSGTTVTFTNGVLAAHSVNFSKGGNFTLTATATSGTASATSNPITINNPSPTISTISPTAVCIGNFPLTVNGTNFNSSSIIKLNSTLLTTTLNSSTKLTAIISAADIASAGTYIITVYNPTPGGGTSVSASLIVTDSWLGTTSDWNSAANWCSGIVPNATTNVVIPSGVTQPIISSSAVCNNIIINSGATLTLNGTNTLTVKGNWTNNGTFTANTSTVVFDGSAQTISNGTFNNLTISGSDTKTLSTVTVNGIVSMEGTATVSTAPTYGPSFTLQYNTTTDRTNGAEWSSFFTGTGGVKLINTGTIILDKTRTYSLPKLTIDEGNLTIPAGGQVTVTGATTIGVAEGLTILSDVSGTGSLITTTASGDGTAKVERYMAPTKWHIVSSPVNGLTVNKFLTDNQSIPSNKTTGYESQKGMCEYNPTDNVWKDYFDINQDNGSITPGKGYSMRVKSTETKVSFIGTLNASVPTITNLIADSWNCIGNPYSSAIRINAADGITNFLDYNSSSFDPLFGAIYLWYQENPEVNNVTVGKYESISNASTSDVVPAGQAFLVRMKEGVQSVSFTKDMQVHNATFALKSTDNVWPTIKLTAMADSITSSTIIAFHEGMTPGLDPTYDAGLLKGGAFVEVYTRLVEDNGIPFDIQALPADYASTIVPVGIDCTKGGPVTFSAELLHVPSSCQVLLEDKLNKVLTDLSVHSYTTDLMGSTVSQNRFFLHTSYSTTGIDSRDGIQTLRAWAVNNLEMKISGKVTSGAIATLYDLQGREVIVSQLQEGNLNSVPLRGLKQGVYMLRVQDNSRVQTQKVMISQ